MGRDTVYWDKRNTKKMATIPTTLEVNASGGSHWITRGKSVCRDNESYDREGRGWRAGRMLSDSQRERSGMDVERPWMIEPGQAYFCLSCRSLWVSLP